MQFSGNFKGKTPILSKFWVQGPPGVTTVGPPDQNPGSTPGVFHNDNNNNDNDHMLGLWLNLKSEITAWSHLQEPWKHTASHNLS